VYKGILKLVPSEEELAFLQRAQEGIEDAETRPIKLEGLHVTLVHQADLKGLDKAAIAKAVASLPVPEIGFEAGPSLREDAEGRRSWALWVQDQSCLKGLVIEFLEAVSGSKQFDPEPERRFHVSLRNRTGNPQDSVR
jgi:2'-5' RNA ligase